jgi:HSP20 family molecular chaperone IbpA
MTEETKGLQVQETEKQEIVENDAERTRAKPAFVPRTDIFESNDEIVLVTDMPGVDEDTVDITLEKNVLTVAGFVEATEPEGYTLSYAEYRVGDYQRSFKLSNEIDQDEIDATIKDGVLRLRLPKVSPTTRKIAVKAN